MPRRLCVSAVIELPDDRWASAGLQLKLSEPWLAMCQHLDDAGIKYQASVEELEVRAKPQRAPRKPRIATVPEAA